MRRIGNLTRRIAVAAVLLMSALPVLAGDLFGIPAVRDDISAADLFRVKAITAPATDFTRPEPFERMQGGAGTSRKRPDADAFSQPAANITLDQDGTFRLGHALFRKLWVSSPSSTQASDGLGPLFNARACQSCHVRDGRGHPPEGGADATSMFLRLARGASNADEEKAFANHEVLNFPDPVYGKQLQDLAVPGLVAEGHMAITYADLAMTLGDGSVVRLRKPTYAIKDLAYGPLDPATTFSPRVTPAMIGLGLVQQISPSDLLAHADPDDRDGDGISGKANLIRDPLTGKFEIGRFGWKAQAPAIRQQTAEAFGNDLGISTTEVPWHWGECTPAEKACLDMPDGVQARLGDVEAPRVVMDLVAFYAQNLAVPGRRDMGKPEVLAGKKTFYDIGCPACHVPKFVTRKDTPDKAQSFQLIWPYSDFLLHDMGEGLADGQTVGLANGSEWRTPPLWGIGLTQRVGGQAFYLHDGRARSLAEAILWHDGEAKAARDRFAALPSADRDSLIRFLESL